MQHLSGRTYEPSMQSPYAAMLGSCLEDFPVSHTVNRAVERQTKTLVTCFLSSRESLVSAGLVPFSSKTSKESLLPNLVGVQKLAYSSMSWDDWKQEVSERRGDYLARQKLAHHTEETECSSLAWPTPTTAEAGKISNRANHGQRGLSNHPTLQGVCNRKPLNKSRGGLPDQPRANTIGKSRGQLNVQWVEQLMGLPLGWTGLDCLETE